jgi:hypothetical protein
MLLSLEIYHACGCNRIDHFTYGVPGPDKIALIIGVDAYYHEGLDGQPSLEQLPSCKKDANDIAGIVSSDKYGYSLYGNTSIIGSKLNKKTGYTQIGHVILRYNKKLHFIWIKHR